MSKKRAYALIGLFGLVIAGLLRQRRRPIPTPAPLTFLFDNPLVEAFDRVLLAFMLGEVRDRGAARELYAALKPGGILSVTEGFGDPDYRRPASVWREVEPAGFELVERFGGFPVYTLNFRRPENLAT